jgi:hypothetical protein
VLHHIFRLQLPESTAKDLAPPQQHQCFI